MGITAKTFSPEKSAHYFSTLLVTLLFFTIRSACSLVAMAKRNSREDDVIKHHEGHTWCDSTERSMNYEIMTDREFKP